ncbi:MAG: YciI family protein [Thermoanaerobaculia bacterium]
MKTRVLCAAACLAAALMSGQEGKPQKAQPSEFLYRIQPARPAMLIESTPEEQALVGKHFAYLKNLTRRGVIILAGRTLNSDPSSFGIVIFRAESQAAAEKIMRGDPAVSAGIFRAELFPYSVALMEGKPVE